MRLVMQLWEEPIQLRHRGSGSGIDGHLQGKVKWGIELLSLDASLWKEGVHWGRQWKVCGPQGNLGRESLKAWRKLAGGPAFRGGRRRRRDAKIFSTVSEGRLEVGAEYRWDGLWQCGELEKACCLPWIFPGRCSPDSDRRCWGRTLKRTDKVEWVCVWRREECGEGLSPRCWVGPAKVRDHR